MIGPCGRVGSGTRRPAARVPTLRSSSIVATCRRRGRSPGRRPPRPPARLEPALVDDAGAAPYAASSPPLSGLARQGRRGTLVDAGGAVLGAPGYSMTTTTSPAPTVSPGVDLDLGDRARPSRRRCGSPSSWPRARTRPGRPRPSSPTATSTFTIVPCMGTVDLARAGRRRRRAGGRRRGRGPARRRPPPARHAAADLGHPHRHREALAVDLDVDVAAHLGGASPSPPAPAAGGRRRRRRRGRGVSSTHLVEWSAATKSGWLEDGEVGGDGGGDALDDASRRSARSMRRAGRLPVAAPDDELADEVVVVLADLVARVVAAVEAHAEAVGRRRAGDRARARAGSARRPGPRR